jgi:hypothetical protein
MADRDPQPRPRRAPFRSLVIWKPLVAVVVGTVLGASVGLAQDTGPQGGTGAGGDEEQGGSKGPVDVTSPGGKITLPRGSTTVTQADAFLLIELGLLEEVILGEIRDNLARLRRQRQDWDREWEDSRRREMEARQPDPSAPDPCLKYTETDPQSDPRFKAASALDGLADRLDEVGDRNGCRAYRAAAEQLRRTEDPPPPPPITSLWIHGRPPGGGPNPGAELVFDVARVATFQEAGVALLSNTWTAPPEWSGAVYAEPDQPRKAAPAPSLDPADWPIGAAPLLSVPLEAPPR